MADSDGYADSYDEQEEHIPGAFESDDEPEYEPRREPTQAPTRPPPQYRPQTTVMAESATPIGIANVRNIKR